jgi:hypothetical protein
MLLGIDKIQCIFNFSELIIIFLKYFYFIIKLFNYVVRYGQNSMYL